MADAKLFGKVVDGYVVSSRKTLNGEQRLMLLRRQPGVPCCSLAEPEKAAQQVAECSERAVVALIRSRRRKG